MLKKVLGTAVMLSFVANSALAANVDINVGVQTGSKSSGGVNVRVGSPPPPPPRTIIVEKERTVVIEEKHDHGKHKGHYKNKKHKKNKHDRD